MLRQFAITLVLITHLNAYRRAENPDSTKGIPEHAKKNNLKIGYGIILLKKSNAFLSLVVDELSSHEKALH